MRYLDAVINGKRVSFAHLKDWPHLRVVLMQSSLRLMGSLRHSEKAGDMV
jgi:hypothetical protein